MTEGGWDVFVSYGHEDAEWVRVLAGNLHRAGFDVFLDEWEPPARRAVVGPWQAGEIDAIFPLCCLTEEAHYVLDLERSGYVPQLERVVLASVAI